MRKSLLILLLLFLSIPNLWAQRLSEAVMNVYNTSLQSAAACTADEYLNRVFDLVWKPLDSSDDIQNSFRRQQQRSYVDFLGLDLNPSPEKEVSTNSLVLRSDAILFIEQHLDKVEAYLKAQQAEGLNAAHYRNLLMRVRKIREKYFNPIINNSN